jgi:signal peptidase II
MSDNDVTAATGWTRPGRAGLEMAVLAASVTVLDLAVKQVARRGLVGRSSFGPFDLAVTYNDGLVMGAASDLGAVPIIVVTGLIAVVVVVMVVRGGVTVAPGGLLIGGAVANVLDRVADGRVTDLVQIGASPVFNLADVSILSGFLLLVATTERGEHRRGDRSDPPRGTL